MKLSRSHARSKEADVRANRRTLLCASLTFPVQAAGCKQAVNFVAFNVPWVAQRAERDGRGTTGSGFRGRPVRGAIRLVALA